MIVPWWLPQLNHLLAPEYHQHIQVSFQWFISLPQTPFGLFLARSIDQEEFPGAPATRSSAAVSAC